MTTQARIIYQPDATPAMPYNVQIWHSNDGGKTFLYAGIGQYCENIFTAMEYATNHADTISNGNM